MRLIRGRASSLPLDRMQGGGTRLQVGVAHLPRKVKQSWLVSYHGLKSLHPAPTANTGLWERNHPPPSFCLRPNTRGSAPRRLTQDAVTQTPLLRQQKRQTSETQLSSEMREAPASPCSLAPVALGPSLVPHPRLEQPLIRENSWQGSFGSGASSCPVPAVPSLADRFCSRPPGQRAFQDRETHLGESRRRTWSFILRCLPP